MGGGAAADADSPLKKPVGAHVFITHPDDAAGQGASLKAMTQRDKDREASRRPPPSPPPATPPATATARASLGRGSKHSSPGGKVSVAVAVTVCEDGPQVRSRATKRLRIGG